MSEQDTGTEYLQRNARELTFNEGSNPHERAKENYMKAQSQVISVDDVAGRWQVALAGSDRVHDVLLLKAPAGDYAGACDCEGFIKGGHVCAHLWFVRIMESLEDLSVPESSNKYAKVMEQSTQYEPTGEDIVEAEQEPQETTVVEEAPMPADPPEPDTNGDAVPPGDGIGMPVERNSRPDAFAEPLPNVDERFIMDMGGEPYIRRAGYARLGQQAGLSHSVEILHRNRGEYVEAKATVTDTDSGRTWEDYGTAHIEGEDMSGAEFNLVELAVTRAVTRAYAWATGEGLTAVAEVQPGEDR